MPPSQLYLDAIHSLCTRVLRTKSTSLPNFILQNYFRSYLEVPEIHPLLCKARCPEDAHSTWVGTRAKHRIKQIAPKYISNVRFVSSQSLREDQPRRLLCSTSTTKVGMKLSLTTNRVECYHKYRCFAGSGDPTCRRESLIFAQEYGRKGTRPQLHSLSRGEILGASYFGKMEAGEW